MTNYDMDELRRRGELDDVERKKEFAKDMLVSENQRDKRQSNTVQLGKDEEPWAVIGIEIKDKDFMKIAREAHARDITFNKMVRIILKDGLTSAEYRFEHDSKPQFLTEKY